MRFEPRTSRLKAPTLPLLNKSHHSTTLHVSADKRKAKALIIGYERIQAMPRMQSEVPWNSRDEMDKKTKSGVCVCACMGGCMHVYAHVCVIWPDW